MDDSAARQMTGWAGLLDRLWRMLARPRLTVVLLVWVAAVLALSTIIPQAPSHIEYPIVRSQWLADVPVNIRPVAERLQAFGVFNLLDSVWLRLPLALLLAHALVMLANLGPVMWHRVGWLFHAFPQDSAGDAPPVAPTESWRPDGVRLSVRSFRFDRDWSKPVERVRQQVINRLEKTGYRVWPGRDQESFVAWRWRWSWLGLVGIYLGLGLIAVGLILAGWLGQVQEISLGPEDPVPLPVADAPNLVLDEVTIVGEDPMSPSTGLASMRVLAGVGESQRLALKLHRSRLFRGAWLTLVALRPVAEVTAVDVETGEIVQLQPFSARTPAQERVRLPLTENPDARFVGVPSENVTLRVDYQADGEDWHSAPAFSLSFFRGADARPSHAASISDGGEETFDEVRYLVTLDYDALLRANSALWWVAVAVGWGVAALSFVVLVVAPPVYVRGQVEAKAEGKAKAKSSRVTLMVEALGDEQRLRQKLRALITPGEI